MTTATLTVTGTEDGADWVEMRCECTTDMTGGPIDPPDSGLPMIDMIETVQLRHKQNGCSCESLVVFLDGHDRKPD
jgi:hypothetical protein